MMQALARLWARFLGIFAGGGKGEEKAQTKSGGGKGEEK